MFIEYPFKTFSDFFTVTVLLVLVIYHLFIYTGRKNVSNEKYNLFFALFSFSFACYVITNSSFYFELIHTIYFLHATIQTLFIIGFFYGALSFLAVLLQLTKRQQIPFYFCYGILIIELLLTFWNVIGTTDEYNKYILNFELIMTACVVIISLITLAYYIVKKRYYINRYLMIIVIGYSLIMLYLMINVFIIGFNFTMERYIKNNWLFVGATIFIFAYALSIKFNNEFKQLIELKNNLEEKVKTRTMELHNAQEEIRKKSEEKINFFINLAHETRTPLTLIANYLHHYLQKNGEDEDITIIKQNIDKLTRDMVNFLDHEKLESGRIFYDHSLITHFSQLCEDRITLFKKIAHNKKITIESKIEKDIFILADPAAIDRIINNLLDNAIKYTGENGTIVIELWLKETNIHFSIKDTGIGMEQSDMENIFNPFYQISSKKRNIQGIGMGLNIVSKIVHALDGTITINSELHKGSEFILIFKRYIPIGDDTINQINLTAPPVVRTTHKQLADTKFDKEKKTILLVEDNHDLLAYMQEELSAMYNVYIAKNGKEALRKLPVINKPHLIISDVMMDEMDGFSFQENISGDFAHIPFIFITAKTSHHHKLKGLQEGAVDYIHKPFLIDELKLKIRSILDISHRQKLKTLDNAISLLNQEKNNLSNNIDENRTQFEDKCRKYHLTDRQIEIVILLKKGYEYKEIADKLSLSGNTINNHMQNIYKKTNTHNKLELINALF